MRGANWQISRMVPGKCLYSGDEKNVGNIQVFRNKTVRQESGCPGSASVPFFGDKPGKMGFDSMDCSFGCHPGLILIAALLLLRKPEFWRKFRFETIIFC